MSQKPTLSVQNLHLLIEKFTKNTFSIPKTAKNSFATHTKTNKNASLSHKASTKMCFRVFCPKTNRMRFRFPISCEYLAKVAVNKRKCMSQRAGICGNANRSLILAQLVAKFLSNVILFCE
jgi:hypothetical protein